MGVEDGDIGGGVGTLEGQAGQQEVYHFLYISL